MHEGRYGKALAAFDRKTASATCCSARAATELCVCDIKHFIVRSSLAQCGVATTDEIDNQCFLCLLYPLDFRDERQRHLTSNARARGRTCRAMTSLEDLLI